MYVFMTPDPYDNKAFAITIFICTLYISNQFQMFPPVIFNHGFHMENEKMH